MRVGFCLVALKSDSLWFIAIHSDLFRHCQALSGIYRSHIRFTLGITIGVIKKEKLNCFVLYISVDVSELKTGGVILFAIATYLK